MAEERILDVLIPPAKNNWGQAEQQAEPSAARQAFRKKLREGQLDDKEIEIDLAAAPMGVEIMAHRRGREVDLNLFVVQLAFTQFFAERLTRG
jgi:ATP-dependent protease HslVU (ClpYQ) ATPase subunit